MTQFSISCLRLLAVTILALQLTACGGGGESTTSSNTVSGLVLSITDAAIDNDRIAEVWVRFTEVIVHASDGTLTTYQVEDNSDPGNIKPYRDIELKSLVSGKTMLLGEIPLTAGNYDWIRLVIDAANTYVVETGGGSYRVKCPSCTQSGFKLNRAFTIDTSGWTDFTIDFDLRKSLTLSNPNRARQDGDYILRPTLRIIDTALASSYIHGSVTDQRSEQVNPAFPDGCVVYVYTGDAASTEPDDICVNSNPGICQATDRPLLTTPVKMDTGTGDYVYDTGLIYPGIYTVALLCEPDDAEADEMLLFMSETGVQADAVAGGATANLALVNVPKLSLLKTLDSHADNDSSSSVTADDILTYRMSITNDGNVTLTNVTVSDPLTDPATLACDSALPATLAPGALLECTADYKVLASDTSIVNTATAASDQAGPVASSVTVQEVNP